MMEALTTDEVDEETAGQPEKVLPQVAVAGVPDVPSDFLNQCLDANELGDGMMYSYLHQGQYIFVAQHNEWYYWAGHYWQRDLTDKAAGAVEKVAGKFGPCYGRWVISGNRFASDDRPDGLSGP